MIKLLVMDVDGTLTDGTIYCSAEGEEILRFSRIDGQGIALLKEKGIDTIAISGEDSIIARKRLGKLFVKFFYAKNKLAILKEYIRFKNVALTEVAYIGDDLNDYEVMKFVKEHSGITGCPSEANSKIKEIASYISLRRGGLGAVRDFIEIILNNEKYLCGIQ